MIDQTVDHRLGETPRAALRDGESVGLADHGQQEPDQSGADGVHPDVGVQGVAGQQQAGPPPTRTGSGSSVAAGSSSVRT